MENHAKYGDSIYFHDDASLYVNLFIASELRWANKNVRVTQTTRFPEEDTTQLTIHTGAPLRLNLKIRYPSWCTNATVTVNDRRHIITSKPGAYIDLDRVWQDGDIVRIRLPMQRQLQPLPNAPTLAAVMKGPSCWLAASALKACPRARI